MGHRHASRHGSRSDFRRGWVADDGTETPDLTNPWRNHREWTGGPWGSGHSGRRGRGGPQGGPPWLAGLFGDGQPERGRGPRVRRGDVRSAILDVVATAQREEQPINGYQVIQQIAERSDGAWRPSPGSVYPTIQQLHDEGLLQSDDELGRKTVRLTATGQTYVAEHAEELAGVWTPFERARRESAETSDRVDLRPEIGQVMGAVWQIVTNGSEAQRAAAVDVLVDARRQLYTILADGPDSETGTDGDTDGEPTA